MGEEGWELDNLTVWKVMMALRYSDSLSVRDDDDDDAHTIIEMNSNCVEW